MKKKQMPNKLASKIASKKAVIGTIGLGYTGLSLLEGFAKAGFSLVGYDINKEKIEALKTKKTFLPSLSLKNLFSLFDAKKFEVSFDSAILKKADVIIISVDSPLNKSGHPNLSSIKAAVKIISHHLKPEMLVVLQSSSYPGTTEEEILPALEKSGMKVGKDFYLACIPEIIDVGNQKFTFFELPKMIGGVTPKCFEVAKKLYAEISAKIVKCSSPKIAESAKLLQNTYRLVNISLINEMKIMFDCMNIDIWEVILAASSKPFGYTPFYPGPGVGGSCIPVTPIFLTWKAKKYDGPTSLIDLAAKVNAKTPRFVVQKVRKALNQQGKIIQGSKILILGVAFKKDIEDVRASPALKIINLLKDLGGKVFYHDPFIKKLHTLKKFSHLEMKSINLKKEKIKNFDCVVICTDHSVYNWKTIAKEAKLIVDTRNALHGICGPSKKIVKA